MKVLCVTMGIAPQSGGPTRSVKGLCRALACQGVDVTLLVLHGQDAFDNPCGVKVVYGLQNCPDIGAFDIVHLQGLWDPLLHQIAARCRKVKKPYVISPRGMLDPWALSVKAWKKKLALFLYQRRDLKHAAAFHATAELEAGNIRKQGLVQPIYIAPNGVDFPESFKRQAKHSGAQRTALFLSRLHPGKGLLVLADAWAEVKPVGWRMRVVGPDDYGHKREVVERLHALGISDSWEFVDAVDDRQKWDEYASADLLVHPSVSENFGITIAEGLAAGLPVICTQGTPWQQVVRDRCGWWIELGREALARALSEAMSLSDGEREEMGARGAHLIRSEYMWNAIGGKVLSGYRFTLKEKVV